MYQPEKSSACMCPFPQMDEEMDATNHPGKLLPITVSSREVIVSLRSAFVLVLMKVLTYKSMCSCPHAVEGTALSSPQNLCLICTLDYTDQLRAIQENPSTQVYQPEKSSACMCRLPHIDKKIPTAKYSVGTLPRCFISCISVHTELLEV